MNCENCCCNDCVRNPFVCLNTPTPCQGCDCDLCKIFPDDDFSVWGCNHYLTLEMINIQLAKENK